MTDRASVRPRLAFWLSAGSCRRSSGSVRFEYPIPLIVAAALSSSLRNYDVVTSERALEALFSSGANHSTHLALRAALSRRFDAAHAVALLIAQKDPSRAGTWPTASRCSATCATRATLEKCWTETVFNMGSEQPQRWKRRVNTTSAGTSAPRRSPWRNSDSNSSSLGDNYRPSIRGSSRRLRSNAALVRA